MKEIQDAEKRSLYGSRVFCNIRKFRQHRCQKNGYDPNYCENNPGIILGTGFTMIADSTAHRMPLRIISTARILAFGQAARHTTSARITFAASIPNDIQTRRIVGNVRQFCLRTDRCGCIKTLMKGKPRFDINWLAVWIHGIGKPNHAVCDVWTDRTKQGRAWTRSQPGALTHSHWVDVANPVSWLCNGPYHPFEFTFESIRAYFAEMT